MKRLRDQGLPAEHLNTVFQAIIIFYLLYAIPPLWRSLISSPTWAALSTPLATPVLTSFDQLALHRW